MKFSFAVNFNSLSQEILDECLYQYIQYLALNQFQDYKSIIDSHMKDDNNEWKKKEYREWQR